MANTDITSRAQYERTDLLAGGEDIRRGSERGSAIYVVVALVIAAALGWGAVQLIDNWAQWVVLGVLLVFTVALMFAVGPNRAGAGKRFTIGR
ncbi:MAG: hypothetical protein ACRDKH_02325 [Solirubrobacterales bacterium]